MNIRGKLLVIVLIALAHAGVYIELQRGDWNSTTVWSDQIGYQRLGAAIATTGKFTRFPDSDTFIPEVIRTPGYPAFVAVVYRLFGVGNNMAVAVMQAMAFAGLALLVFAMVRRISSESTALVAALLTALFSPLPYFGALTVTELMTTVVATAAIAMCMRAVQRGRPGDFAIAGFLFSATTLMRPAFVLMPFFFAIAMPLLSRSQRSANMLKGWAIVAAVAVLTLMPWFAYNYSNLGQLTLSPAGGVGRGLWEGSWQGRWTGKIQADLINTADATMDRAELTRKIRVKAEELKLPAQPMLDYVNQWRDIRAIWDTPTDPMERARARVVADREYLRQAWLNITADPVGHVFRRLTRGVFVLWAADIPIPYGRIDSTPALVIRGIWLVQVVLLLVAVAGAWSLARNGRWTEAVFLVLPLIYVTAVHLPLLCEARQSLPVKPVVLALAAVAICRRSGDS